MSGSICGSRYGVQSTICTLPPGHDEWHDDGVGQWAIEPPVQESRTFKETERSTIADEAQAAVYGDRGKDYGHPRENFTDTAALWSALLADRLSAPITPEDVARCMIAVKLARDLHSPKRDNRVDIVGYAITLDRLETGL